MTATRRPWWRRWPTVIAAVIVVLAAVGVFIATRSTTETAYRTATASVGNVQQTVPLTGTLAATHQQGANFAVAGKVTLVAVTPGTKVAAGQVLATIDPASLELTVTKSEATLAAAQSQLSADQVAHAAGGTGAPTDARLASDQASLELVRCAHLGQAGRDRRHVGRPDRRHGHRRQRGSGGRGHRQGRELHELCDHRQRGDQRQFRHLQRHQSLDRIRG